MAAASGFRVRREVALDTQLISVSTTVVKDITLPGSITSTPFKFTRIGNLVTMSWDTSLFTIATPTANIIIGSVPIGFEPIYAGSLILNYGQNFPVLMNIAAAAPPNTVDGKFQVIWIGADLAINLKATDATTLPASTVGGAKMWGGSCSWTTQ
jgi:hypothetical protein